MKRTIRIAATSGVVMLGIAACGGSKSPAPAANASPTVAASPGASTAGGGTGAGAGNRGALAGIAAELPQIKTCLDAAGISTADLPTAVPTFAPRASGAPRPSFNPSNRPTARPTGGFGGGGGRNAGLFSIFSNQADLTALKACGITVPTFTGRGAGGGSFGGEGAPGGPGGPGGVPDGAPATA